MKKEDENIKVVLLIDMNCVCDNCFKKIAKCIQNLEGIKLLNIEDTGVKYEVTVRSKMEPSKLQKKIEKKMKQKVELISPKPQENKGKEDPKKITFETNLGCHKCVKKIENIVTKTKGFQGIFIDRQNNLLIVSGSIDADYLVKKLEKKMKKYFRIIKQEKYEDHDVNQIWCPNYYYNYGPEFNQCVHEEDEYCRIM
ncbi:heavy metal-associated isoprenylated plant protein 3-like [Capsicum annuum]